MDTYNGREGTNISEVPKIENYVTISDDTEKTLQMDDNGVVKDIDLVKMAYYFSQGYNINDISAAMSIGRTTVQNALRSDEFKEVVNSLTLEVVNVARMFLATSGIQAVKTIIDCMNSPNDRVRLQAAKEVLDRIGLTEPTKIEVLSEGNAFGGMSDEQMLAFIKGSMAELTTSAKVGEDIE